MFSLSTVATLKSWIFFLSYLSNFLTIKFQYTWLTLNILCKWLLLMLNLSKNLMLLIAKISLRKFMKSSFDPMAIIKGWPWILCGGWQEPFDFLVKMGVINSVAILVLTRGRKDKKAKEEWIKIGLQVMKTAVEEYPDQCLSNTVNYHFYILFFLVVRHYAECPILGRGY